MPEALPNESRDTPPPPRRNRYTDILTRVHTQTNIEICIFFIYNVHLYKNIHMYIYTHRDTGSSRSTATPRPRANAGDLATPRLSRPAPSIARSIPPAEDPHPASPSRIPARAPAGPAVYLRPTRHAPPAAPIGSRPSAGREGRPRPPIRRRSRRSARAPAYGPLSSNRTEEREEARPIGRRLPPPSRCRVAACEAAAPPWWGGAGRCPSLGSRGVPE